MEQGGIRTEVTGGATIAQAVLKEAEAPALLKQWYGLKQRQLEGLLASRQMADARTRAAHEGVVTAPGFKRPAARQRITGPSAASPVPRTVIYSVLLAVLFAVILRMLGGRGD